MTTRRFVNQWIGFSLAVGLVLALFELRAEFHPHRILTWSTYALYVVGSLCIWIFGKRAAESVDKNQFTNFYITTIIVKLLFSLALVLIYKHWAEPQGKYFILPFLLVYLFFTGFEIYFLTKISKQ